MDNFRNPYRSRRYIANVNLMGTTQLHLRNPYTIACWSLAFPGFGHLLLNKYLRGFALVLWELFINQKIHLNLAMVHSFNGNFQAAKEVLEPKYMAMYIPVYLFAVWDSYRSTIDVNKQFIIARGENKPLSTFSISPLGLNYLDKRKPWISAAWAVTIPSLGQLYQHQILSAAFFLTATIVLMENSNLLLAIHYLILGDLEHSNAVLNAQWLMYLPSFYFYSIYESYTSAVENNKLFDREMRTYLVQHFQPAGRVFRVKERIE
ncbi:hypothetical protein [Paenibacillus sp.]|uniref:hypothetical protein n=1 Tax=Paenibacillus sp. TaxID=58172 RepID=UPI002811FAE7|nr:hypothetical protein [Paenibacillus sp.]